jgi:hypothetical protein
MSTDYLILIPHLYRYSERSGRIHWQRHLNGGAKAYLRKCPTQNYLLKVGPDYCLAQNVVWFLVHGEWPSRPIRHRNGQWWDNRIENLELVARA